MVGYNNLLTQVTFDKTVNFNLNWDVNIGKENGQVDCEVGDIGYWPDGNGFCIFFGPTPASKGEKPRAASPVNIFARIEGDAKVFNQFPSFKGSVRKGV